MALIKTSYVERVVITLNRDGSLKGAHQSGLEIVSDNGAVISERETPAAPVDVVTLAKILPDAAALTSQISALATERDGLRAELENIGAVPASSEAGLSKLALIDRLSEAGLFDAALAALKADPLKYERWQASTSVDAANPDVRALLSAIGGNVDGLLGVE